MVGCLLTHHAGCLPGSLEQQTCRAAQTSGPSCSPWESHTKSHSPGFCRDQMPPGSQSCSWRCCKSGGGGFSCHRPEVWRVFLAALLCRLVVTLPRVLAPCSSLLGTVGQGRVGFGLQASRHTPCNLVVAGDAGKCSGEDPAPGGPSGVLHMWCNPSKGAGLVGIQPGDPHAEF